AGPQCTTVNRVAQVHGIERQGHLEKLFQFRHGTFIVLTAARNGENHVIIVKAFRVAETMQRIGHGYLMALAGSPFFTSTGLVILPSPILVFARSNRYPRRSRMGATTSSSPFSSQRVPTPSATTVSMCCSTSRTRRMISSVR